MIRRTLVSAALAALPLAALPFAAFAHEGHGFEGPHWHSTDVWGFVVVISLAAAAIWYGRRK